MAAFRKVSFILVAMFYLPDHHRRCATGQETQATEQTEAINVTPEAPALDPSDSTLLVDVDEQTTVFGLIDRNTTVFTVAQDYPSLDDVISRDDARTSKSTNLNSIKCANSSICPLDYFHSSPGICSCHPYCYLFNDCCENAPLVHLNGSDSAIALPRTAYSCYMYEGTSFSSVNIITSCAPSYGDDFIALACNKSRNLLDFDEKLDSLSTPVTDSTTGVTYGNMFCALCWGVSKHTAVSWLWNFHCRGSTAEDEQLLNTTQHKSGDSSLATLTYLRKFCTFSYLPPNISTPVTACVTWETSECSEKFDSNDSLSALCRSGPMLRINDGQQTYRNTYCVACNGNKTSDLMWSCGITFPKVVPFWTFSILVSPSAESCTTDKGDSPSFSVNVDALCRTLAGCVAQSSQSVQCPGVCPLGLVYELGGCRAPNATSPCSFGDVVDESAVARSYWSYFASDVLIVQVNATSTTCYSCVFTSFTNYTLTANASVVVNLNGTSRVYSRQLYYVQNGSVNVCTSARSVSTLMPSVAAGVGCTSLPEWVSIVLLILSECCLLAYLVLYIAAARLRHFPGDMVLSMSVAFFLGFAFFLFRRLAGDSSSACKALAVLVHYFLLAAFVWTTLYALEVTRALSSSPVMPSLENRRRVRRIAYQAIGWCLPLLPVLLGVVADEVGLQFRPLYGLPQCFIGSRLGHVALFVGPLCACLTIDVAVYCYVIVRLAAVERQTRLARDTRREKLLLSAKLLVALGVLWALAAAASFSDAEALQCAFTVVDSLQGAFVLLIFGIKRNVIASVPRCLVLGEKRADKTVATFDDSGSQPPCDAASS